MQRALTFFAALIACLVLGLALLAGGAAAAQEVTKTPTLITPLGPTLPPTWTSTPAHPPTDTPRPIPTREPSLTPTPSPTPYPTLPPPPAAFSLAGGMTLVYQEYNGCAPAALTMMLLFHGWDGSRDVCNAALRPNGNDVSVRTSEMIAFAEENGLRGVERTGGTLSLLKSIIAAGFPVLVENVDGPQGEWWGHNRVVMGYDDSRQAVLTFDSTFGAGPNNTGRPLGYSEFDALWQPFNRTYLILFPPEAQAQIEALLGAQWNATENARRTLAQAEHELTLDPNNAFAWFNVGESKVLLGEFEEAARAFDRARDLGLPWRMMWYQFGPFEAYLATGRYGDAIALGQEVLNTTNNAEEIFYYMALAYAAQGDVEQARTYFMRALTRNPGYVEAGLALERLNHGEAAAAAGS